MRSRWLYTKNKFLSLSLSRRYAAAERASRASLARARVPGRSGTRSVPGANRPTPMRVLQVSFRDLVGQRRRSRLVGERRRSGLAAVRPGLVIFFTSGVVRHSRRLARVVVRKSRARQARCFEIASTWSPERPSIDQEPMIRRPEERAFAGRSDRRRGRDSNPRWSLIPILA